ncbi:MAG: sialate O-acetylesterase, partial [Prolixibacteraceae bacterium]|nr:sialate O-acetylesterase [Prolixibacteraceae bacterium]
MRSILFFLAILFVYPLYGQKDVDARTRFFPREEIKPLRIPNKNKVWVFILAGQSNMAGRGWVEPQDTVPSERILTINRHGEIIVAKEPLHFYEPTMTGLDCGISFGRELIKNIPQDISVLLIPAAVGGSSASQWLGDSLFRNVQLLTNFEDKVRLAKKTGKIKGVLWHQGESDAKEKDIPLYKERLTELFAKFRKISGNRKLPIVMGE